MKKAPSGAFFISREADAEHRRAAYTCPLPTQHGLFFCPLERRGPRSAKRWQDLRPMHDSRTLGTKTPRQDSRAMHDFEALDAKRPPPWQDSRAMHPKSPDCIPKRIHRTKILPSSARKACISRKRCQGGASFRAIGEKRIHGARILPHQPKQPYKHEEAIGRRSIRPKEGPGGNRQIAQHQGDAHESIVLDSPKQRSNQPATKAVAARTSTLAI